MYLYFVAGAKTDCVVDDNLHITPGMVLSATELKEALKKCHYLDVVACLGIEDAREMSKAIKEDCGIE